MIYKRDSFLCSEKLTTTQNNGIMKKMISLLFLVVVTSSALAQNKYINIDTTFEPSLELTEKIKKSTLKQLIVEKVQKDIKTYGNGVPYIENPYYARRDTKPKVKKIPINSNLSKVYFLEDFDSFVKCNSDYYNSIVEAENNKREKIMQNERNKKWDKYL